MGIIYIHQNTSHCPYRQQIHRRTLEGRNLLVSEANASVNELSLKEEGTMRARWQDRER